MGVNREYIPNWKNVNLNQSGYSYMYLQYMRRKSYAGYTNQNLYKINCDLINYSYFGAVLTNKYYIYLVPFNKATSASWDFIDLSLSTNYINDSATTYINTYSADLVSEAYAGGVLTKDDYIYFIPYNQATCVYWHYIYDGTIYSYDNTVQGECVENAYVGGGIINNLIFFAPYNQATSNSLHYIDSSGNINSYNNMSMVQFAYNGAVLNKSADRLYFIPFYQSTEPEWHFIDIDGNIQSFANETQIDFNAPSYSGGVLAPDGKIYMIPYSQGNSIWHYISIDGEIKSYSPNISSLVNEAYRGGVLAPNGKIYMIPYKQATSTIWHYIDTTKEVGSNGHVVEYSHNITATCSYAGGVLSPNGRVYMVSNSDYNNTIYYIDTESTEYVSITVSTSPFYNKF